MKFVGIDFGHGEVSASYYDGIRLERLRLVRTTSTNEEEFKLPSYLYKCLNTNEGTFWYDIQEHNPCTLLSEMKKPINEMTNEEKTYYQKFVKLVYARLLELNHELLKGNDFELAIACPTKWNADQKMAYKSFVEQALNLNGKIYAIMNESDAAYFALKDDTNEPTLVVDYGSSTIDFTCVANGRKVEDLDQESSLLGASKMEDILLNIYKNDAQTQHAYQEVERRVNPVLAACHRDWIKHDGFLKADLREKKEKMFSSGKENLKGKVYLSAYEHPGRPELKGIYYEYAFEEKVMEMDRIKQYVASVKNDIIKIKSKIDGYHIQVQKIILSGGASCMPWVKDVLMEVFELTDQQIARDEYHPSFVVCDGIVKYCYERQKCLETFLKEIDEIDIPDIIKRTDEDVINSMRFSLLSDVFYHYASASNSRTTIDDLLDDIIDKTFRIFNTSNEEYVYKVNQHIRERLIEFIEKHLQKVISGVFNISVAHIESTKAKFPIAEIIRPYYKEETLRDVREYIKNEIIDNLSLPFILFYITYDKPRIKSHREIIVAELKKDVSMSKFDEIERLMDFKELGNGIVEEVKKYIHTYAMDLFDEMELFKTRFTI